MQAIKDLSNMLNCKLDDLQTTSIFCAAVCHVLYSRQNNSKKGYAIETQSVTYQNF